MGIIPLKFLKRNQQHIKKPLIPNFIINSSLKKLNKLQNTAINNIEPILKSIHKNKVENSLRVNVTTRIIPTNIQLIIQIVCNI